MGNILACAKRWQSRRTRSYSNRFFLTNFGVHINIIFLLLLIGDRTAVAKYLLRRYPNKFQKQNTAQVYVTRVMQRVQNALENGAGAATPNLMGDRRSSGAERVKPVTGNPEVQRVVDHIFSLRDGNVKATL